MQYVGLRGRGNLLRTASAAVITGKLEHNLMYIRATTARKHSHKACSTQKQENMSDGKSSQSDVNEKDNVGIRVSVDVVPFNFDKNHPSIRITLT